jgi:hypothetical protein
MRAHPTVTASTMIAHFNLERKVRCHTGAVETILARARSLLPEDFAEGDAVTRQELLPRGLILEFSFVLRGRSSADKRARENLLGSKSCDCRG